MPTGTRRGARKARSGAAQTAKDSREAPGSMDEDEVTIEVEDLADFAESINILLYGPSGHGKTVLAGGAPNAVFVSTEKGVIAARQLEIHLERHQTILSSRRSRPSTQVMLSCRQKRRCRASRLAVCQPRHPAAVRALKRLYA